ncbi:PadR family transcriptional regulator [Acerihabitans arboris]|uniref:PadR family transcriptional regulator n=1 Tax=Acerihabitans arboris TaxID=2691583 RepID=A0A845SHF0_9GAMM|nr:PadR family transcriptional regulator [Acerihabitans arboris]NDL62737.1 PadR family transcriptional regulator [Acerihabitans arboris]
MLYHQHYILRARDERGDAPAGCGHGRRADAPEGRGGQEHGGPHGGRGHGHHEHHGGEHRMQRLFGHGDLRMILLALVARKPSYGYELIKDIELASSGLYVPSPGVIYPTLSLLVDQDFLTSASAEGQSRKNYQITPAGEAELAGHQAAINSLFERLAQAGKRAQGSLIPGITESMGQLKGLLRGNMLRADLTPEQVARINAALLGAVNLIEDVLNAPVAGEDK